MKSTKTTETPRINRIDCCYCSMEVKPEHQQEKALDRDRLEVGKVHSGFCAHQWRLKIIGAAGFIGF